MSIFNDLIPIKVKNNICLTGMTDEFFCLYISNLLKKTNRNILVLTSSLFEANKLVNSLNNYTNNALLFPMDDFLTSESLAISPDLKITRLETINKLLDDSKKILVTDLNGYLRFLPTKEIYQKSVIKLKKGQIYERDELVKNLTKIGYTRETLVVKTGEMAVRGFVIDVFPIEENNPIRIEYFDDEIESIRYFDESTQKSISEISQIEIYPVSEFISDNQTDSDKQKYLQDNSKKVVSINDYLDDNITIYKDYSQIKLSYQKMVEEQFEYRTNRDQDFSGNYNFNLDDISPKDIIYYNTIDNLVKGIDKENIYNFNVKEIGNFNENIDAINKYLQENLYFGKTIVICLKDYQIKSLINYLNVEYILTNEDKIFDHQLNIINKVIDRGFSYGDYIFLTEKELFKTKTNTNKYKTKFKYATKIKSLNNLEIGDYVVHNIHGIGIYNGIKTLKKKDLVKDYLEILYQGKDKLYIPVEKIDLISKYTGKEGMIPKVHKLGGTEWKKTKLRVKNKVKDIAEKLIKLYAMREMQEGYAFSPDSELQAMFENDFQYQETPDQLLAIKQIKEDMESKSPMDRLLCGDVGYGKTEVAFRAMFKAVNDSKQVMYLCPTTILSTQQYESAKERFKNYPVQIEVLNRFTSVKETKRILNDFKDGRVDILFGTHRILSHDVIPKDLGLLIIDEEQRFGVTHKEKIKEYKQNVDVLTLSATPIPRTLQMSLVGIRSLSLIETPPVNRYPIQTYVIEENDQLIKDCIYKELSRGGQVYILYNKVEKIDVELAKLKRLVPDAKIEYAHGQLSKNELEEKMQAFVDHEFDVLLCTTIIETGIDIPNVNTLIILDADRFGLSQLYQIRGRVGRSDKIAYAYLMYNRGKALTETAIKRLNVIKDFTELGSGFAIATRDLSIRGAGDILGSEQAGFIDTIGIDLYLKILDEEVKRLKGEQIPEETQEADKPLVEVNTHINDQYVEETELKIEIHKKINTIDSYEKLLEIKSELEDRFGKIDDDILLYMYEEWFEKISKKLNIVNVRENKTSVEVVFDEETTQKIDGEKLFMDAYNISNQFRFQMKGNHLIVILDKVKLEKHYLYYLIDLLNTIELQ